MNWISAKIADGGRLVIPAEYRRELGMEPGDEVIIRDFDVKLACMAAALRPTTKKLGLSLGDRSCLALGLARRGTVVTDEKAWAKLKIGVKIDLIR